MIVPIRPSSERRSDTDDVAAASESEEPLHLPLLRPVENRLGWSDLYFPSRLSDQLQQLVARWRNRLEVADRWGFRRRTKSQGLIALFAGPPGTGKTEAASVCAQELGLQLYSVNTAAILSKYVGETEKNLELLLSGVDHRADKVALLFDEGDTLFGKRFESLKGSGEVAHNSQVGLLLSRLERSNGLAIVSTNHPDAVDVAFKRRFAEYIDFEMPDANARREILRICLAEAPLADDVDLDCLHDVELSGGAIQNIALRAAHRALAQGRDDIDQATLWRAVIDEVVKDGGLIACGEEEENDDA